MRKSIVMVTWHIQEYTLPGNIRGLGLHGSADAYQAVSASVTLTSVNSDTVVLTSRWDSNVDYVCKKATCRDWDSTVALLAGFTL